ncbi:MAG: D-sedoheptulose 7-phosphate isomerase [Bacteroidota bacterium]|nr:D-sedoheptulose 7-phosphate isomerase [Bacteroidota bacterium]
MDRIKNIIQTSIDTKKLMLENEPLIQDLDRLADQIVDSLKKNKKVYFCGNGGSAADAQHLAAELSGRFYSDRPALAAEALHVNTSYLTAVANDYSYDVVYERLIAGIGQKEDVLIGISTSGNSKNVVLALKVARDKGLITVGLTGSSGGEMKGICDYWFGVPSDDTPRIQESHILLGHIICQLVEEKYFPPTN